MNEPTTSGISRRTLAKGAAWSIPVVAIASAAPAYAHSGNPPTITVLGGCKQPGESCSSFGFSKGYTFTVKLYNSTDQTIYLYSPTSGTFQPYFEVDSTKNFTYAGAGYYLPGPPATTGDLVGTVIELAPGQTKYIAINAASSNSSQSSASGSLWFSWGHTSSPGGDTDHPYLPTPWDGGDPPYGEGWIGGPFTISKFNPCDSSTCLP